MEPQLPSPHQSPESGPAHSPEGEIFSLPVNPENGQKKPETTEVQETREQHTGGPAGDPVIGTTPLPLLPPLPTVRQTDDTSHTVGDPTNPASAADDDLIEKEWVEKAKKVIAETKHDPYMQEHEVSKLQADYLKKRYGKAVNMPSDG